MTTAMPRDDRPGGADQRRIQAVIDEIGEHAAGQPISTLRERVVAALRDAGFSPPSESWIDAVAREAVHGHAYVVNFETAAGTMPAAVEHPAIAEAPAQLPTTTAPAEDRVNAPRLEGTDDGAMTPTAAEHPGAPSSISDGVTPVPAGPDRRRLAALLAAAALITLVLVVRRRGRRRSRSGVAEANP